MNIQISHTNQCVCDENGDGVRKVFLTAHENSEIWASTSNGYEFGKNHIILPAGSTAPFPNEYVLTSKEHPHMNIKSRDNPFKDDVWSTVYLEKCKCESK